MVSRRLNSACLVLILTTVLTQSGCIQLNTWSEDYRLKSSANKHFSEINDEFPVGRSSRHFERGWKQGFYNARLGNGIEIPSVPSAAYLSNRYETPRGMNAKQAWTAGYQQGVRAANESNLTR